MRDLPSLLALLACLATATPSFAAAPSHVWVSARWAKAADCRPHTWKVDAFGTIQDAVAEVAAGGTVSVASEIYAGKVIIDHPLALCGPCAGISPNAPSPDDPFAANPARANPAMEAVVAPGPASLDQPRGALLEVRADDVTIDGLTIDGNPPGPAMGGAAMARDGVLFEGGAWQRITIRNNIIRNLARSGITCSTKGPHSLGNRIEENRIDNLPLGPDSLPYLTPGVDTADGIRTGNEFYSHIAGNTILRVAHGIHVSNLVTQLGEMDGREPGPVVTGNHISAYRTGIIVNLVFDHFYAGPIIIVANNTITIPPALDDAEHPDRYGLCLLAIHGSSRLLALGNEISGGEAGIFVYDTSGSEVGPSVDIERGRITGSMYGIWLSNTFPFGPAGSDSAILVRGVFVRKTTAAAIYVEDDPKAQHSATVLVSNGVRVFDGARGVLVHGGRAHVQFLPGWCSAQLTGQNGDYITLEGNGQTFPGDVNVSSVLFGGGEDYHQGRHLKDLAPVDLAKVQDKLSGQNKTRLGKIE